MSEWVVNLLNMSISASIVAIVVMLIRLIFKKIAPKRLVVLLWVLVAVRLVCPISIESDISIMPNDPVQMVQSYRAEHTKQAQNAAVPENADDAEDKWDNTSNNAANNTSNNTANADDVLTNQDFASLPSQPVGNGAAAQNTDVSTAHKLSAGEIAFIVWASGTIVMLIYMIISYVLLHRQVRVSSGI